MQAAQQYLSAETPCQADTFHAISHRLGAWLKRLEKTAYGCIAIEYEKQRFSENAKSHKVLQERATVWQIAKQETLKAIEQYQSFGFLYHRILEQLNIFDSNGKLHCKKRARQTIEIALEYLARLQTK